MPAKNAEAASARLVPVPGLNFEPVDATPEQAEELLASGSFMREDAPIAHSSVGPGGQPHAIGEAGPELFTPTEPGVVLPAPEPEG